MRTRVFPSVLIFAVLTCCATAEEPRTPPTRPETKSSPAAAADVKASLQRDLDAYLDRRWLPQAEADKATQEVLDKLRKAGCTIEECERLLRAGRAHYGTPKLAGKLTLLGDLQCEHVDYKTSCFLYVPKSYDPAKAAPLLLVGHGGNSAMSADYAKKAALGGLNPWLPVVERKGMVLAAPLSERGWGPVGNSILLSAISRLQRELHLNPDRIYVTGHSMGGHLSWRSAIQMPDRWGAVSPMSGGYDYVDNKLVFTLVDCPGYATFGTKEPYGINGFDKKIAKWMAEHNFDWKLAEKRGGHEIFKDEIPKIAHFLLTHPRNLYRSRVYGVGGPSVVFDGEENPRWSCKHTWNPDRPIPRSTFHWIRMYPLPKDSPADKSTERVWAENLGDNRIRLTSQFVRRLRIYLHPKMIDFATPVEVVANGRIVFQGKVEPSLKTMLELVREFDDRSRIFYAAIDVDIPTDAEVPEPRGEAVQTAGQ